MIECSKFATEIFESKISPDVRLKLGSILQAESTEKSSFSIMAKNIAERFKVALTEKEQLSV